MVPAQCFVHDLIRFVSFLSSGSFPPLFVSSFPLLRLLSSSLRLLFSGFFPPLLRLLSSSRPVFLSSSPPLLLSSSYSLLLFSESFLLFIQVLSSSPAPLLFSGSCPPLFLFLLIPFSHRCSIQPSLSIYSNFFSYL